MNESLRQDPPRSITELVVQFESLGDNCELGLVQRFCGAEPLGLFRFSFCHYDELLHALETEFSYYGTDDDLEVVVAAPDEWVCRSKRYGFPYHTGARATDLSADEALARELKKVDYLKNRLLSDLRSPHRLLVRKGHKSDTAESIRPLSAALRRYGDNTLLWVVEADARTPPGTVEVVGDGILKGYVSRFAPYYNAHDIDLESWLELCANAYRQWRGVSCEQAFAPRANLLSDVAVERKPWSTWMSVISRSDRQVPWLSPTEKPARHVLTEEPDTHGLRYSFRYFRGLAAQRIYVVSCWVWIPADFAGTKVTAIFAGRDKLASRDADLSQRNCWQRVWTSAKVPRGRDDANLALAVAGNQGDFVYSTTWRLEEGPIPSAPTLRAHRHGRFRRIVGR